MAQSLIKVTYEPTDKLLPYVMNVKDHSDRQVKELAASIVEFGFYNPILLRDDYTVVAGHGRLLAAERLGLEEVPVIFLDQLTKEQTKALAIADNKLPENATWNKEKLAIELKDLKLKNFKMEALGFNAGEVKDLLDSLKDRNPLGDEPAQEDKDDANDDVSDDDLIGNTERVILIYEREDFEEFGNLMRDYLDVCDMEDIPSAILNLLRDWDANSRS